MADEDTSPSSAPPAPALCKQCRAEIPSDARLCRHCNSYQDWRGYLSLSGTVLALLVALVSVLAVTLPPIVGALRPINSRIGVSSPVIRGEAVYVVASNLGSRPGVIQRGQIQSRYIGMDTELDMINPAEAFIQPGAKQVGLHIRLRLSVSDAQRQMLNIAMDGLRGNPRRPAGTIGLWLQDSDGRETYVTLPVSFEDLSTLLSAHADRCQASTTPPSMVNGCSGIRELQEEGDRLHRQIQNDLGADNPERR